MPLINASRLAMRKLSGTWYVKQVDSGRLFSLSGTASLLWDLLISHNTVDHVVADFRDSFDDAPSSAVQDVINVMQQMHSEGLLNPLEAPTFLRERSRTSVVTGGYSSHTTFATTGDVADEMRRHAETLNTPVLCEYEMTYRCNLRCAYCYQPDSVKHMTSGELTPSEISAMLLDFARNGVFYLVLTGGECTLTKNFLFTVEEARRLNFDVSILTNGTNLSQSLVGFLKRSGVSEVKVSIYGNTSEQYVDFTKSSAAFTRVEQALLRAKQSGLHIMAKVIITSFHETTYADTIALLNDLDIPHECSAYVMPDMFGGMEPLKYKVSSDTLTKLMTSGVLQKSEARLCTAGTAKFRVSPNGTVTSCELVRSGLGNVKTHSINDILHSSNASRLTNIVHTSSAWLRNNEPTRHMTCSALNVIEHGDWFVSSTEAKRWTRITQDLESSKVADGGVMLENKSMEGQ
jgi:MoaA/NifB/PqqE/SkfB family radical SAM enzyme